MVELRGLTVINLIGRTFMGSDYDDPFRAADALVSSAKAGNAVLVDFHAEATSEKQALGWYLDGRASAVIGTHTHVPTADQRILPRGTAYCTDAGMCGARDSVIGDEVDAVLQRFLTQMPTRLPAADGTAVINGVLVEIDDSTGRAKSIVRSDHVVD
jgi:metallophosphoesterase (TIGR00282 family)